MPYSRVILSRNSSSYKIASLKTNTLLLLLLLYYYYFLNPGTQFPWWVKKLSTKNKAGMVSNPGGTQQKNCRAARRS